MLLKPPGFWDKPIQDCNLITRSVTRILAPFSLVTFYLGHKRKKHSAPSVPVPVFCCGNITTGGTGKTPLALDLAKRLHEKGRTPHFLTRGYGSKKKYAKNKVLRVCPATHNAVDTGDEALLLAHTAPTWCSRNRYMAALHAITAGADCLIMDDGLQNNSLHKDYSILVIDGPTGLGNGYLLPAGPLRESPAHLHNRINAICLMGEDRHRIAAFFPESVLVLRASFIPDCDVTSLAGKRIFAFSAIGQPGKFFSMLAKIGLPPTYCTSFADHYLYTEQDVEKLAAKARKNNAILVTTQKDAIKIPKRFLKEIFVITVKIQWEHEDSINALIEDSLSP